MTLAGAATLLLAGCGGAGTSHFDRADVSGLITLSNRIARETPCAQARDIRILRSRSLALVKTQRVPASLQEPFMSGVSELQAQTPACVPPAPPAPVTTTNTAPPPTHHGKHEQPKPPKHHHGHGHDKGGD